MSAAMVVNGDGSNRRWMWDVRDVEGKFQAGTWTLRGAGGLGCLQPVDRVEWRELEMEWLGIVAHLVRAPSAKQVLCRTFPEKANPRICTYRRRRE